MPDYKQKKLLEIHERIISHKTNSIPTIAFMSDFGNTDAVATCHQMIKRVDFNIDVVDFNHNVNQFNIEHASVLLQRSKDFLDGTVFCCVVDPGVGTTRKPIILTTKSRNFIFIGPNNGIFTDVSELYGIDEIYEISPKRVNPNWSGFTFDGRDLYAPAAGIVASIGKDILHLIGFKINISECIKLNTSLRVQMNHSVITAKILAIDEPFGNIWTGILSNDLEKIGIQKGDLLNIELKNQTLQFHWKHAFGDVEYKENVAYLDSRNGIGNGFFALGINQGDFRKIYNVHNGDFIKISKA